jgi:hypothetical protein
MNRRSCATSKTVPRDTGKLPNLFKVGICLEQFHCLLDRIAKLRRDRLGSGSTSRGRKYSEVSDSTKNPVDNQQECPLECSAVVN